MTCDICEGSYTVINKVHHTNTARHQSVFLKMYDKDSLDNKINKIEITVDNIKLDFVKKISDEFDKLKIHLKKV